MITRRLNRIVVSVSLETVSENEYGMDEKELHESCGFGELYDDIMKFLGGITDGKISIENIPVKAKSLAERLGEYYVVEESYEPDYSEEERDEDDFAEREWEV